MADQDAKELIARARKVAANIAGQVGNEAEWAEVGLLRDLCTKLEAATRAMEMLATVVTRRRERMEDRGLRSDAALRGRFDEIDAALAAATAAGWKA